MKFGLILSPGVLGSKFVLHGQPYFDGYGMDDDDDKLGMICGGLQDHRVTLLSELFCGHVCEDYLIKKYLRQY